MFAGIARSIVVVATLTYLHTETQAQYTDECILLPSELGPDWYKIPQPFDTNVFTGSNSEPAYYHMPCAATTIFDQEVCGCTTIVSMLYAAFLKKRGRYDGAVGRGDIVKKVTEPPPLRAKEDKPGSIFLNTRTGEVTSCPFRTSPDAPNLYLVRTPDRSWTEMRCAAGTVFDQRTCTCIHILLARRHKARKDDIDIIVLKPRHGNNGEDEADPTLSKTLNIKLSDVMFDKLMHGPSPFGNDAMHETPRDIKPDVKVVLNPEDLDKNHRSNVANPLPQVVTSVTPELSPYLQDKANRNKAFQDDSNVIIFQPIADVPDRPGHPNDIPTFRREKQQADKQRVHDPGRWTAIPAYDEIVFPLEECLKKPTVELGPNYFSIYLHGIGWTPYACHGDRIYNHRLCACVPTIVEKTVTNCRYSPSPRGNAWYQVRAAGNMWKNMQCATGAVFDPQKCRCVHDNGEIQLSTEKSFRTGTTSTANESFKQERKEVKDDNSYRTENISTSESPETRISTSENKTSENTSHTTSHPHENGKIETITTPIVEETNNEVNLKEREVVKSSKEKETLTAVQRKTTCRFSPSPRGNTWYQVRAAGNTWQSMQCATGTVFDPQKCRCIHDIDRLHVEELEQEDDSTRKGEKETLTTSYPEGGVEPRENRKLEDNITSLDRTDHNDNRDSDDTEYDTDIAFDEIYLPMEECHKQPVPGLGPQFFSVYLLDIGWLPYKCTGNQIYQHTTCTCENITHGVT